MVLKYVYRSEYSLPAVPWREYADLVTATDALKKRITTLLRTMGLGKSPTPHHIPLKIPDVPPYL